MRQQVTSGEMARQRPVQGRQHAAVGVQQPRPLLLARSRKLGLKLLHQQCWCWGCDIKRPAGNLLLEYGFERQRPPEGVLGSSAYYHRPAQDEHMTMWGFGLCYRWEGQGAIYLGRYTFLPALLETPLQGLHIWAPEDVPATTLPQTDREKERARQLLARALRRIVAYEGWVIATHGLEYRQQCLTSWRQNSLPATEAIEAWLALAEECEQSA